MGSVGLVEEIHTRLMAGDFNANIALLAKKHGKSHEHVIEMGYYVLEKEILPRYS